MENHKIRVAITQGDTNGVGLELILKAFSEMDVLELCTPIIYSSQKTILDYANELGLNTHLNFIKNASEARDGKVNVVSCYTEEVPLDLGLSSKESSLAGVKALDQALTDHRDGLYDVLVCCPMENNIINAGGYKFADQTRYIETSIDKNCHTTAIYLNEMMRMATVTDHDSLSTVAAAITAENMTEKIRTMHQSLKRDFRLSNPRIAVLALNPSTNGKEEEEVIRPVIAEQATKGIQVFGPYQADTFFGNREFEAFDGILAMYHDQAMLPVRMITDSAIVRILTGMPLVCTMPDCGTMMEVAGKNVVEPQALYSAIYAAIDIFRFRQEYDAPMGNPLPKLYHERPDNGEKLRFSIPKKKEE